LQEQIIAKIMTKNWIWHKNIKLLFIYRILSCKLRYFKLGTFSKLFEYVLLRKYKRDQPRSIDRRCIKSRACRILGVWDCIEHYDVSVKWGWLYTMVCCCQSIWLSERRITGWEALWKISCKLNKRNMRCRKYMF